MKIIKDPLQEKYLYLPLICKKNAKFKGNVYQKIENFDRKGILEEIAVYDNNISKMKKQLKRIKFEGIKKMIIFNRSIPSSWKSKNNYDEVLNKILLEKGVLSQAIANIKNSLSQRQYNLGLQMDSVKKDMPKIKPPQKIEKRNNRSSLNIRRFIPKRNASVKESHDDNDPFILTKLRYKKSLSTAHLL